MAKPRFKSKAKKIRGGSGLKSSQKQANISASHVSGATSNVHSNNEKTAVYRAKKLREKANRRIARLQKEAENENIHAYTRNQIWQRIGELQEAAANSYVTGKTDKQIHEALSTLESTIEQTPARYKSEGDPFETTSRELAKATSKAKDSSVFSNVEAKNFYKQTQHIWKREGIINDERNAQILNDLNKKRADMGLTPITLDKAVEDINRITKNKMRQRNIDPSKDMTEEEKRELEKAQQDDRSDEDHYEEELTYTEMMSGLETLWTYEKITEDTTTTV